MNQMTTRESTVLSPALSLALEAAGDVIEFWGFKRNHGRLWALLFIYNRPLTAVEIGKSLGLSKGGVSIVVRELEQWGVVHRVRGGGSVWRYAAETDFLRMIGRVLAQREQTVSQRAEATLQQALQQADAERLPREQLNRIRQMLKLARWASAAVATFTKTARFEARNVLQIFRREAA